MASKKELLRQNKMLQSLLKNEKKRVTELNTQVLVLNKDIDYLKKTFILNLENLKIQISQYSNEYSLLNLKYSNNKFNINYLFKYLDILFLRISSEPEIILEKFENI